MAVCRTHTLTSTARAAHALDRRGDGLMPYTLQLRAQDVLTAKVPLGTTRKHTAMCTRMHTSVHR